MNGPHAERQPASSSGENETTSPLLVGPEGRETGAQFRELMAHLKQVFWIRNQADTAVLYISPTYETIWGRSRASLYDNSHTFLDSVQPEDRDRVAAAMSGTHATEGYDEEYRILRPDGTERWIWARAYPVRDDQGEIRRYAGIAEDISERKWAEKERLRLAAIIEFAEDSVINTTLEGVVIGWNRGAERKYGYQAEEVIGRSISVLIPPAQSHEYSAVIKRVQAGEAVSAFETVRLRKDGTPITLSIAIAPIEARDGKMIGISKICRDISEVSRLEAQLIEAQKMEVIGQLTGGVAHDFNNILAVILGHAELLLQKQDADADPARRKSLGSIHKAAERGAALTRQLLIFSRQETVQFAALDLNEVLAGMEGMLRQLVDEGITLALTPGAEPLQVKADRGYLEQVLMNLVVNARDAMPGGGKLFIALTAVTLDEGCVALHSGAVAGEYVMLSVSDTGIGMSGLVRARLFEPLFTTKPKGKGTGLGLATCQTIVRKCGGHIDVSTEVGRGTTFKIYFPRIAVPTAATAGPFFAPLPPRGTEKILVVEDEPEVRQLISEMLRGQGYEVLTANNGEEGLRAISFQQGAAIRLVISDVIMPQMGGREMNEKLQAKDAGLKILFTSGYTDDAISQYGLIDRRIAFLSKPYSIGVLARKVRELLDAPDAHLGVRAERA